MKSKTSQSDDVILFFYLVWILPALTFFMVRLDQQVDKSDSDAVIIYHL